MIVERDPMGRIVVCEWCVGLLQAGDVDRVWAWGWPSGVARWRIAAFDASRLGTERCGHPRKYWGDGHAERHGGDKVCRLRTDGS